MLYFYLEDFVVNAIIESERINGTRKILIKTANIYGEEVIKKLKQKGYHAQIKNINERAIQIFEEKRSDYFIPYLEEAEKGYLLKDNVSIEELEKTFRKNFTPEIVSTFSDEIIVHQTLDINKYSKLEKECDHPLHLQPCLFLTEYSHEKSFKKEPENNLAETIGVNYCKHKGLVKKKRSESSKNY